MAESRLVEKLNENQQKVEASDLDQIKELRDAYKTQTVKIGQLNVERILMNQAVDRLNIAIADEEKAYTDLQEREQKLV